MEAAKIIIEPVLTEKTNQLRDRQGKKYTFKVATEANKIEIMGAVKKLFSVKPVKCNVINVKPKPKMARTRSGQRKGATTGWKKAVISLAPGDKIDRVEGT